MSKNTPLHKALYLSFILGIASCNHTQVFGRLLNAISEAQSPIALAATGPPTILRAVAALETMRQSGGPQVWLRGQCVSG